MNEKRFLYFALGVLTVVSVGAVSLHDQGVQFPDGTLQTSAAVAAAHPALSSFKHYCTETISATATFNSCELPPVPAGKMAVIEFIEGHLTTPGDQGGEMWVGSSGFGWFGTVDLRHQQIDEYSNHISVVSQPYRTYMDEGQYLALTVHRNVSVGDAWFHVWVSGYLVDKAN
jgi:hypothetical protein